MPVTPDSLVKGTEVWWVRIEDHAGLLETPELRHGVVTGGGPSQVLIQWDHEASVERSNRCWQAERLSASPEHAWDAAYDQLSCAWRTYEQVQAVAMRAQLHVNAKLIEFDKARNAK